MATRKTFIPGREISFYKGGAPSRLQYNPVRQYYSNKLDKYQMKIFILADMSGGNNVMYHIDEFQNKNFNNISIPPDLWKLLTSQMQQ